ncbi:hypothetical protein I5Q23_23970 [Serratia marcescens]|nr:hypothetical protein [Serratia marcescens]
MFLIGLLLVNDQERKHDDVAIVKTGVVLTTLTVLLRPERSCWSKRDSHSSRERMFLIWLLLVNDQERKHDDVAIVKTGVVLTTLTTYPVADSTVTTFAMLFLKGNSLFSGKLNTHIVRMISFPEKSSSFNEHGYRF